MMNPLIVLLFLKNIYLQYQSTGNPIVDFLNNAFVPKESTVGGTVVLAPDWIPSVSFILFMVLLFFLYRYFVLSRRRPNNEEPVGTLEMIVPKYGQFEAYVNRWEEPLKNKYLRALKNNRKLGTGVVEELLRLRNTGKIHFYQGYYRRTRELVVDTMRKSRTPFMIISTMDLTEKNVAVSQSHPQWSWFTFSTEYIKTVITHQSSHKVEVEFGHDYIDVWFIAPIPIIQERTTLKNEKKLQKTQTHIPVFDTNSQTIEITVLPYSEELAKIAPNIILASKQVEYIENLNERIDTQDRELRERDNLISKLQGAKSELIKALAKKSLRKADIRPDLFNGKDELVWLGLGSLVALLFTLIPRMSPDLATHEPLGYGIIGMIIVFSIRHILVGKKQQELQKAIDDTESNYK